MIIIPSNNIASTILNMRPILYLDGNNPLNNNASIPTDGSGLSTITDLTGNNIFLQATGGSQIIYKKNIINGGNVFRFGGTQYAECANNSFNQYAANTDLSVFMIGNNTNDLGISEQFITKGVFPTGGWAAYTNLAIDAYSFVATTKAQYECTTNVFSSSFQIYSSLFTAASGSTTFYKNGANAETKTGTTGSVAYTGTMQFGTDNAKARFWHGDIRALIVFYRLLNTNELNAMHSILKSMLGI